MTTKKKIPKESSSSSSSRSPPPLLTSSSSSSFSFDEQQHQEQQQPQQHQHQHQQQQQHQESRRSSARSSMRRASSSSLRRSSSSSLSHEYELYKHRWVLLGSYCLLSLSSSWIASSSSSSSTKDDEIGGLELEPAYQYYSLVYLIASCGSMWFTTRYGIRRGTLLSATLNLLGSLIHYTHASAVISTARSSSKTGGWQWGTFLCAWGQTFLLTLPPLIATNWFAQKERGVATAIGMMMYPIGNLLGQILPWLIDLGHCTTATSNLLTNTTNAHAAAAMEDLFCLPKLQTYLLLQAMMAGLSIMVVFYFVHDKPINPPSYAAQWIQREIDDEKTMEYYKRNSYCYSYSSGLDLQENLISMETYKPRIGRLKDPAAYAELPPDEETPLLGSTKKTPDTPDTECSDSSDHESNNNDQSNNKQDCPAPSVSLQPRTSGSSFFDYYNDKDGSSNPQHRTTTTTPTTAATATNNNEQQLPPPLPNKYLRSIRCLWTNNLTFSLSFALSIGVYYTIPAIWLSTSSSQSLLLLYIGSSIVGSYASGMILDHHQQQQQQQQHHQKLAICFLGIALLSVIGFAFARDLPPIMITSSSQILIALINNNNIGRKALTIFGITGCGLGLSGWHVVAYDFGTAIAFPANEAAVLSVMESLAKAFALVMVFFYNISSNNQTSVVISAASTAMGETTNNSYELENTGIVLVALMVPLLLLATTTYESQRPTTTTTGGSNHHRRRSTKRRSSVTLVEPASQV